MFNFFSSVLGSIKNTFSAIGTSFDPNFSGLFQALSEKKWETIKKTIGYSAVNQYADQYNNNLLFLAIEAKEYELVRYLLTLENVKNHASLDSYLPLLVAIAKKDNDAFNYILDNIPSITKHVTDDDNTILINAFLNKNWEAAYTLITLPAVQNTLSILNFNFIAQQMQLEEQNVKGYVAFILLNVPKIYAYYKETLSPEQFEDLKGIAHNFASEIIDGDLNYPSEIPVEASSALISKCKNYAPKFDNTGSEHKYRKTKPYNTKSSVVIEEILDESDTLDIESEEACHTGKRQRMI